MKGGRSSIGAAFLRAAAPAAVSVLVVSLVVAGGEFVARLGRQTESFIDHLVPVDGNPDYLHLSSDKKRMTRPRDAESGGSGRPRFAALGRKRDKEIRIAVFGASTTFGTPFPRRGAFPHLLQVILARQWPGYRIRVYSFGFFAQTYRFVLDTVLAAVDLEPDYLVVYSGHNELYPHNLYWTAQSETPPLTNLGRLRPLLEKNLVLYGLFFDWRHHEDTPPDYEHLLASFDWQGCIPAAISSYRRTTARIVEAAEDCGAILLYLTPLRNVRDFPPSPGVDRLPILAESEAAGMSRAEHLGPSALYRLARYLETQGQVERARQYYERASDSTIRVGRVHSEILHFIERLSELYPAVRVVDLYEPFRRHYGLEFLGDSVFVDWCHLRMEGNYLVARVTAREISRLIEKTEGGGVERPVPDYEEVIDAAIPAPDDFWRVGYEEAGFIQVQFARWELALQYLGLSVAYRRSLKSLMGLALANSELGRSTAADELAAEITANWPPGEIEASIKEFYVFEERRMREILRSPADPSH